MNAEYWDNRYKTGMTGWDIGYPSPPLMGLMQDVHKNTATLIPGAGYGHEALSLAELGYTDVTVLDISQSPLDRLSKHKHSENLKLIQGDFFDHQGAYDVLLEQTFFCALDPSLRASYVKKAADLLKPNGRLMGVLFNTHFEGGPPFGGNTEAYKALFSPFFILQKLEECTRSIPQRMGNEVEFIFIKK